MAEVTNETAGMNLLWLQRSTTLCVVWDVWSSHRGGVWRSLP